MEDIPQPIRSAIVNAVRLAYFPYSYYNRRKLLRIAQRNEKTFIKSIEASEIVLKTLSEQSNKRSGYESDWNLASASFFAANLALDLNTAVLFAAASWRKQKKEFIWRTVAMTLYEGISQYSKFVMPALFRSLSGKNVSLELLTAHKNCAKRFGRLFLDHREYLSAIRNNCMAHREIDYEGFKKARASVSETRIMGCLSEFVMIEQEVQKIFGAAFRKATQINA
ncbi:MAG: hypothetical protein AB7V08_09565 [Elusimicrobiales bacterium]